MRPPPATLRPTEEASAFSSESAPSTVSVLLRDRLLRAGFLGQDWSITVPDTRPADLGPPGVTWFNTANWSGVESADWIAHISNQDRACELWAESERLMSGYAVAVAVPAILRRSGILDGHGAVIAPGPDSPNGVFIAGESGAGKSSLTLAAAVGGAQFVSDDSVALRVDSDEVRAFARRTVMLLSPEVLTRLVPKIAFERADTKALIRAPIAFPSGWRPQMGVRAVAFLQGNQGSASPLTSRIRRLSGAESYARLLMAHPILAVDAGARPAFGAVRALARLPSFSVQVGRELLDPGAATRVIRVLLEQVRG